MELQRTLQSFQQRLLLAVHLKSFTQTNQPNPFIIVIEVSKDRYALSFADGSVDLTMSAEGENGENGENGEKFAVLIKGGEAALLDLINGQDRLQKLQKRKELSLQGSYCNILKAETIFYLNQ